MAQSLSQTGQELCEVHPHGSDTLIKIAITNLMTKRLAHF